MEVLRSIMSFMFVYLLLLSCLMATTTMPKAIHHRRRVQDGIKKTAFPNYLHSINYRLRRRRSPSERYYRPTSNNVGHNYKNDYWNDEDYNDLFQIPSSIKYHHKSSFNKDADTTKYKQNLDRTYNSNFKKTNNKLLDDGRFESYDDYGQYSYEDYNWNYGDYSNDQDNVFPMSSEVYHKSTVQKDFTSPTLELMTKTMNAQKLEQKYNAIFKNYNELMRDKRRRNGQYDDEYQPNENYPPSQQQQQSYNSYYPSKKMLLGLLKPLLIPILLLFLFLFILFSSSLTPVIVQQQQHQQQQSSNDNNNNNNDIVVILINATGRVV